MCEWVSERADLFQFSAELFYALNREKIDDKIEHALNRNRTIFGQLILSTTGLAGHSNSTNIKPEPISLTSLVTP